ncbi:hypothetical protein BDR06DRAFT_972899 [Suillus hirtellus]|nr:hypothetical protein BDR06DRAFT_972899 [Suillus hirtellus]
MVLLQNHTTGEARSRFLAPFSPEQFRVHERHYNKTQDCISFWDIWRHTAVYVEAKLQIGSDEDRLNAVALVMAECDGQAFLSHRSSYHVVEPTACDWSDMQVNFFYVDLQHALRQKQFFVFDGGTKPYKLSMGAIRESRFRVAGGLALDGFLSKLTARPFIHGLCPICETIFNLPLFAYITSLKVFHYQLSPASRDWKRKRLDSCDSNQAPKSIEEALEKFQAVEIQV